MADRWVGGVGADGKCGRRRPVVLSPAAALAGILGFAGCDGTPGTGVDPDDDGTPDDDASDDDVSDDDTAPDDDASDDDAAPPTGTHFLLTHDGWANAHPDPVVAELDGDLDLVWALDLGDGYAAQGIWRYPDGRTLYTRIESTPPNDAMLELADAEGDVAFSWELQGLGGLSFTHGVVVTPDGDYVLADTDGFRLIAVDSDGDLLWSLDGLGEDTDWPGLPNGIDLKDQGGGDVRLLVSIRGSREYPPGTYVDQLIEYRMKGRTEPPELIWAWPSPVDPSELVLAHGPRFGPDGIRMICSSDHDEVVAVDADANPLWRLPPAGREDTFIQPRDAILLEDGRLVVADSGHGDLVIVEDPFGAFVEAQRVSAPGVFAVRELACGATDGLPCLGPGD